MTALLSRPRFRPRAPAVSAVLPASWATTPPAETMSPPPSAACPAPTSPAASTPAASAGSSTKPRSVAMCPATESPPMATIAAVSAVLSRTEISATATRWPTSWAVPILPWAVSSASPTPRTFPTAMRRDPFRGAAPMWRLSWGSAPSRMASPRSRIVSAGTRRFRSALPTRWEHPLPTCIPETKERYRPRRSLRHGRRRSGT